MFMGCLYFILMIIALYLIISIGSVVLPVVALFFLIMAFINYKTCEHLRESKMQCPNCNSDNVKISSLQTGSETQTQMTGSGGILWGIGFIGGKKNTNIAYSFKREAICQECGFNYDYLTSDDINNIKQKNTTRLIASAIFFVLALALSITFWLSTAPEKSNDKEIWATEYTPLNQFDYYLDGNQVYLKEYTGKSKKVKINSVYEKDGQQYNVVTFAEGVFALESVTSVILPEGLKSMPSNTFNSCGVKYVYIPSTLEPNEKNNHYAFYDYFHDVEIIYYGGSEEEWKILTNNVDRAEIDAKEIKYNVNINELK